MYHLLHIVLLLHLLDWELLLFFSEPFKNQLINIIASSFWMYVHELPMRLICLFLRRLSG